MSARAPEIRPLTGVRGVAAMFVVAYHYSFVASPYPRIDSDLLGRGYLAVDLFFMLSGMVLAMRYQSAVAAGSDARHYRHFLKNRIARVYPLYLAILAFTLPTGSASDLYGLPPFPACGNTLVILANFLMIQSWVSLHSINWVTWSLSTEMAAYLLFPVLCAVAFHRNRAVAYVSAIVCVMLLCVASLHDPADTAYRFGYLDVYKAIDTKPVLRCVAGFTYGLLAYRLAQVSSVKKLMSANLMFVGVVMFTLASFYVGLHDLIVYLGLLLLVLCCYGNSTASNVVFGNRIVHFLGLISYSIYLVHPLFYRFIPGAVAWTSAHCGAFGAIVYHGTPYLPVIAVSYCTYRVIEVCGGRYAKRLLGLSARKDMPLTQHANQRGDIKDD